MKFSSGIEDSIELRFSTLARCANREGRDIISFGLGEPDFPTPVPVIEAAAKAMRDGFTRYSDPLGLSELRERICGKLAAENGVRVESNRVLVAPGAKMALSLALGAILEPGDEVINISPCYSSYVPQILIAEPTATIHNVGLRRLDFRLDLDRIADLLGPRTKAVLINSPHNPTGWMIAESEAATLVSLLKDSACYIVSDEVYERLNFGRAPHVSIGRYPEVAARTVTINGFSKAYAMTGWRIGYLAAPEALMSRISRLQQHLNTNTATFIQKAALAALDLPDDYIAAYNARLRANAECLAVAVADTNALSLVAPSGGLFAFVNIASTGMDSDSFASGLLESHDVAATPGVAFGRDWNDHVRVSLAIDADRFRLGAERLSAFAARAA